MTMIGRKYGWPAVCLMLLAHSAAQACPSCYASVDKPVAYTYYLSTIVLSLLPFGIVGTVALISYALSRRPANAPG